MTDTVGLLINSSRGIIYASKEEDFAQAAANKARDLQEQMEAVLEV
jgi:orotidine-5'-phosphate decarboxylase